MCCLEKKEGCSVVMRNREFVLYISCLGEEGHCFTGRSNEGLGHGPGYYI